MTTVCVDSCTNGQMTGRFYSPHRTEGEAFCSLAKFIVKMESIFAETDFPQSFTATRSFNTATVYAQDGEPQAQQPQGAVGTFLLRILFRQNTSWQGTIIWLEERKEQSFRSVLELILLLDSALSSAEESGEG